MRPSSPWLVALVAVLLAAGAYGSPSGGEKGREEEQRQRILELERHKRVSEVEIARLRQEIARLQRELQAAKEEAEMARRDAVEARAERPREPEEPLLPPHAIEEDDVSAEEMEIRDAPAAAAAAGRSAEPEEAVSAPPPPTEPVTEEIRELYDASYTLFHERRYDEAEKSFTRFLEQNPRTDLSDNAQFWIGECHYARGDYDRALAAFMATVERYPSGNKVPDALVKAGKSLEGLGDRDGAIETYREILRRFEGTAAAAIASERLVAMNAR